MIHEYKLNHSSKNLGLAIVLIDYLLIHFSGIPLEEILIFLRSNYWLKLYYVLLAQQAPLRDCLVLVPE